MTQKHFTFQPGQCVALMVAAGFLAAVAGTSQAQETTADTKVEAKKKNVDPSGTWRWESDQEGRQVKHELKLNYDAKSNKVTGTYQGSGDPEKIKSGRMEGNKLITSMEMVRNNVDVRIDTEAIIDGDVITATSTYDADGTSGSIEWSAKRSLQASDVVGTWDLEIETDDRTMQASIKLSGEGEELKGQYTGFNGQFKTEAKDIAVKDGKLTFTITADRDGSTLTADYVVIPRGDSLKGEIEYDFNGNTGKLEVAGKRKQE